MTKVSCRFTMSLDGFIADANDDISLLFPWYFQGEVAYPVPGTQMTFKTAQASAITIHEMFDDCGAIVTGRRDFDVSNQWGGKPPIDVPCFIVTHNVPQEWAGDGSPFIFVTDGVESAIAQAKQKVTEDKVIAVGGTQIVRQCLQAGLLEQIEIDLAPILLGQGIRLFDQLGADPIQLEIERVIDAPLVTHIRYRVKK